MTPSSSIDIDCFKCYKDAIYTGLSKSTAPQAPSITSVTFENIEIETFNFVSAPRSKDETFGNPQNLKGIALKRGKNPRGYEVGARLLNHPAWCCQIARFAYALYYDVLVSKYEHRGCFNIDARIDLSMMSTLDFFTYLNRIGFY